MAEHFDQIKYNNEYNRLNYDRISLMAPKGRKGIRVNNRQCGICIVLDLGLRRRGGRSNLI